MRVIQEINTELVEKILKLMDLNTQKHCIRTSRLAYNLAKEVDIESKHIKNAALIHDVGKSFINDNLLNKKGTLCKLEKNILDLHSYIGYEYLKEIGVDERICELVLFHHGTEKLKRLGISYNRVDARAKIEAEIIRAADAYDALTSIRPYRKSCNHNEAIKIMKSDKIFNYTLIDILDFWNSSPKDRCKVNLASI